MVQVLDALTARFRVYGARAHWLHIGRSYIFIVLRSQAWVFADFLSG